MLSIAIYLFRLFNAVVTFRSGPSALPANNSLIVFTITIYALLGFSIAQVLGESAPKAVLATIIDTAFYMIWFGGLVRLMGKPERIQQTLLCILLIGVLAGGLGLALAFSRLGTTPETMPVSVALVGLLIIVWVISLLGRCMAEAIDKPVSIGVAITIAYIFINDLIIRAIS